MVNAIREDSGGLFRREHQVNILNHAQSIDEKQENKDLKREMEHVVINNLFHLNNLVNSVVQALKNLLNTISGEADEVNDLESNIGLLDDLCLEMSALLCFLQDDCDLTQAGYYAKRFEFIALTAEEDQKIRNHDISRKVRDRIKSCNDHAQQVFTAVSSGLEYIWHHLS